MRLLICGGRAFGDGVAVGRALAWAHARRGIDLLIEGGATGADRLGREWAQYHNIPVQTFHALWGSLGRRAGPIRNAQMLAEGQPDEVVAFPGGRGTSNMIEAAFAAGVAVWSPVRTP
jgi:predicted Rossmann-fold nucleotide-binding protein